jgi:hypothetical protein
MDDASVLMYGLKNRLAALPNPESLPMAQN